MQLIIHGRNCKREVVLLYIMGSYDQQLLCSTSCICISSSGSTECDKTSPKVCKTIPPWLPGIIHAQLAEEPSTKPRTVRSSQGVHFSSTVATFFTLCLISLTAQSVLSRSRFFPEAKTFNHRLQTSVRGRRGRQLQSLY